MITIYELKDRLSKQFDPVSLVEELGIDSEDIVERFEDFILDQFDKLKDLIEEEQEENEE